jgi:hypothetical protein
MPEEVQQAAETQEQIAAPSTEEQNQPTESAAGEQQQESADNGGDGEEAKPKPKGGFQKRIDRLTQEKEFWKTEALKGKPVAESAQEKPQGKPKSDDFATHDEFVEALVDWKADQKIQAVETSRKKEEAIEPLKKAQRDFAASVDDYHETMAEATDVPVNENVLTYLKDPDIGPQLGYFLAKNPDEAHRLVKLGARALATEITALESRFLKSSPSEKTATVSKAPPPPNLSGRSSASSTKDPGDMSPAEYREWRAKTYPNL